MASTHESLVSLYRGVMLAKILDTIKPDISCIPYRAYDCTMTSANCITAVLTEWIRKNKGRTPHPAVTPARLTARLLYEPAGWSQWLEPELELELEPESPPPSDSRPAAALSKLPSFFTFS